MLERLGWWLYQSLHCVALAVAAPVLLIRRGRHYLETLPGRLGFHGTAGSDAPTRPLWIHAVSVGEVGVAATLARGLPPDLPLLVTTVTPTGQAHARRLFTGEKATHRAQVAYLPFDLGWTVGRFFRRFRPRALVLVEGDYWPLVLRTARRHGLPVAVVNGRMGDRSSRRLAKIPALGRRLFWHAVDLFAVQTKQDRDRLEAAGADADRVHVTGNLKFETPTPEPKADLEAAVERLAGGRPILIAGSTMDGEDEQVLDALSRLGGGDRALLILVPRHPERWDGVARLVEGRGFILVRRSALLRRSALVRRSTLGGEGLPQRPDVLLLDSLGELSALYRLGRGAFIGGTLVPTGGHNPLEPATFSVPVVVGPSMHNFRDMAERFDRAEAWSRVDDAKALAEVWRQWVEDPAAARALGERAAALLEENRGARQRTLQQLEPLIAAASDGGPR